MKLTLKPLTAAFLIASALNSGVAFAQTADASVRSKPTVAQTHHQTSTTVVAGKTSFLSSGAEIFENLTEAAPTMDAVAFKKSLSEFEAPYPETSSRLSLRGCCSRRWSQLAGVVGRSESIVTHRRS